MKPIQQYLEQLASELGATRLSLLLFSGSGSARRSLLLDVGDGDPIPELESLSSAEHLINGALASSRVDSFASSAPDCQLLFVPKQAIERGGEHPERRQHPTGEPGYWLGLRSNAEAPALSAARRELIGASIRLAAQLYTGESQRSDPDSGLPDRGEFERTLARIIALTAGEGEQSSGAGFSALLVQPRTLLADSARALLPAVADNLSEMLRDSDQLYRYGATALALPLPGVDPVALKGLCHKLAAGLAASPWPGLDPAPQWHVVGLHCANDLAGTSRNVDIAQRLEAALRQCQIRAGSQIELLSFDPAESGGEQTVVDGLFTGEAVRDYRNMGLLWRMVGLIGDASNASALMIDAVNLIGAALDSPVALFELQEEQSLRIASSGNLPNQPTAIERLMRRALTDGLVDEQIAGQRFVACPATGTMIDPLVLIVDDEARQFEVHDATLLDALVLQLYRAVERLKVAAQEVDVRENETKRLRAQLAAAGQSAAAPVFVSGAMQRLLQQADSWSRTVETILITGESGAGKEIMAARVHESSDRADGPFVTVDCAAIPGTLLEAELFGRVKGAYTGADSASAGYARKAAGGTLFLDEIGELPIDLQAKLLRFVQEKQVSPVGSSDSHQVDVRIIAATNRDLGAEVRAGRFRGDLMYRLKVLELRLPPLRERTEDIVPLASYFLDSYNAQYQRNCLLTAQAEDQLRSYRWPGNVRELKHSILKACLECSDEQILPEDIGFTEAEPGTAGEGAPMTQSWPLNPAAPPPAAMATGTAPPATSANDAGPGPVSLADTWLAVESMLAETCEAAISQALRLPFGSWINDALIEAADLHASGVSKHAAGLIGLPESTYRRQLDRVRQAEQCGMRVTHPLFEPLPQLLRALLAQSVAERNEDPAATPDDEGSLIDAVRARLLRLVSQALPDQCGYAAALMGVTPPTYRRHLKNLEALDAAPREASAQ